MINYSNNDVLVAPDGSWLNYGIVPQRYRVYTSGTNGSVTAAPNSGYTGTEVTLSNTPAAGYEFVSYSVTGATLKNANQFDIGTSNVYVDGVFTKALPKYPGYMLRIYGTVNPYSENNQSQVIIQNLMVNNNHYNTVNSVAYHADGNRVGSMSAAELASFNDGEYVIHNHICEDPYTYYSELFFVSPDSLQGYGITLHKLGGRKIMLYGEITSPYITWELIEEYNIPDFTGSWYTYYKDFTV